MRWVWRAEHGGFKIEYGALFLLVATIATAILAFGMPTRVQEFYVVAMCRIDPEREDCEPYGGGPGTGDGNGSDDDGSQGDGQDGDGQEGDGEDTGDGEGSEDGEGGEEDEGEGEEGDESEDEEDTFDPALLEEVSDANSELADAEQELADAEQQLEDAGYDEVYDALIEVVADIVGWTDAKKCITEGDIIACLTTIVGLSPWGKGLKLIKNSGKILKLWNRFRKAKKARDAAKKLVDKARGKVKDKKKARDTAATTCSTGNSFVAGTPVLMADGSTLYIEDIEAGDEVLAFDPVTGEEGPREVTATITGDGPKDLVDLVAEVDGSTITMTATAGHPFWLPEEAEWTDAGDIAPGDRLRTPSGAWAEVTSADGYGVDERQVFNLSVAGTHTYYAGDGPTQALVHNAPPKGCGLTPGKNAPRFDSKTVKNGEFKGGRFRIDVENSYPDKPGSANVHIQLKGRGFDQRKDKYFYNPEDGTWTNKDGVALPKKVEKLVSNADIDKALGYLDLKRP
ncbi:Hint domain-containing protein [Nocardiopsis sp. RSe5-2]|uniref:Hint domain-containing protein n=1 Tax=Nocardiopsis endophytica TaxID=3018445 RepID=A0ABT4U2I0_9ACTN|nr:Hint domain-containing protein [Nocardiopsis endophytica]MDA2811157.1 Hint domain-containing protein [Nocardiopsis endophytica]